MKPVGDAARGPGAPAGGGAGRRPPVGHPTSASQRRCLVADSFVTSHPEVTVWGAPQNARCGETRSELPKRSSTVSYEKRRAKIDGENGE